MFPNILWLMTDEQRTDSLGGYGSPWAHSPHLDRLCREGVVFDNAYTPSPVCQPARESILSGLYPSQTWVWYNLGSHSLERTYLTRQLSDAGYRSASFGKQHYSGSQHAFAEEKSMVLSEAVDCYGYAPQYDEADYGVVKYPGAVADWVLGGQFPEPASHKKEYEIVDEAIAWLAAGDAGTPFFLRLSFSAPHTPVVPPVPFDTLIAEDAIQFPPESTGMAEGFPQWVYRQADSRGSQRLTEAQLRQARRYYYGECAFVDQQFGRLLTWMEQHGMLEDTIIVYVADHGTHLGDYGLVQKGTFFETVARVPYFFWYPKHIPAGTHLHTPVETRTLVPTLLALAGLEVPEPYQSNVMADNVRSGGEPDSRPVFSEISMGLHDTRYVMVREGPYKLMMQMDPVPGDGMLVDLENDPWERDNLINQPQVRAIQNRLSDLIMQHLAGTELPYPNVKLCPSAHFRDPSSIACPECGRTARSRQVPVDGDIAWARNLAIAYQCGHCGTRFGTFAA